MSWYKKLGFRRNPLEVNPLKNREEPIGLHDEIDRLLYYVDSGNAVLIQGPSGSGKTLLLGQIIRNYGGKGRIIYIDGNKVNKRLDVSKLLIQNQGMWRKFLNKRPKGMILLLDNAIALPRKSYELIQYYFDQDYLKSIVFTTDDKKKLNFPVSLHDRIGNRTIKLKSMSEEDAIDLVLERLNQDVISKDKLEKIYILSDKNLKEFMRNTELVVSYMVENELDDIDIKTLNKVLGSKEKEDEEDDTEICLQCSEPLVKVGDQYRCKECDMYCPECGVLISEDDYECPNCGVQFEEEE